jgi:hypothetical protein
MTDDIPLVNAVPEKYRGWVLLLLLASPYITRAFHALASGGGLRGVMAAIWLGTNTPKEVQQAVETVKASALMPALVLSLVAGAMLGMGCANMNRTLYNTESLAVDGVISGVSSFNAYYKSATNADHAATVRLDPMRDKIYRDVDDFRVTVDAIDHLRVSYAANSANTNLTSIQILLVTAGLESSNIVYDIKWFLNGGAK